MENLTTPAQPVFSETDVLPFLIRYFLSNGNAISLWQMPHSTEKHLLVCLDGLRQVDDISLEESETGFVFAPFNKKKKKIFLKGDLILSFSQGELKTPLPEELAARFHQRNADAAAERVHYPVRPVPASAFSDHYQDLVRKSIELIRQGVFEKVVPSRCASFPLPEGFDLWRTFSNLSTAYPNCMISLVSSEETGTWMGATPELLVSVDDQQQFRTVALAGTKRNSPGLDLKSVAWTEKEIEEQALVCRYIISCFKKIRLREYIEQGPRTAVAGNLLHLKTEYKVDMAATHFPQLGSIMLNLLHPTSAVCGMPLEPAVSFLEENEGYDRQFYSGFLGPVNFRNESHLFVNLRCMQLEEKHAVLYAGAGVTIDSQPDKEFEETRMKFDTLHSFLR